MYTEQQSINEWYRARTGAVRRRRRGVCSDRSEGNSSNEHFTRQVSAGSMWRWQDSSRAQQRPRRSSTHGAGQAAWPSQQLGKWQRGVAAAISGSELGQEGESQLVQAAGEKGFHAIVRVTPSLPKAPQPVRCALVV